MQRLKSKGPASKEPLYANLRRRLAAVKGLHSRIAAETGVAQSTVSRIHHGQQVPTLTLVQPILDWLDRYDVAQAAASAATAKAQRKAALEQTQQTEVAIE